MKKKTYLISRAFLNFLIASVLTSISTQLTLLIDSIIVSNTIAPEALSAMNMAIPVTYLVGGIIPFLCMGASIIAAKKIGAQQYNEASRIFSVALTSGVMFYIFLSLLSVIFIRPIATFLCSDGTIYPYLHDYLSIFLIGITINFIFSCICMFIGVDGKPKLVTKAVIVASVSDIILDLFFILVLDCGMKGAALATVLSQVIGISLLIPHFFKKDASIHLINPFPKFISILKENLQQGTPFLVAGLVSSIVFFFINRIILNHLGADGIYYLSVCMQVMLIYAFVVNGAGDSILSIGGVLIGEKDWDSLRSLIKKCFLFLNVGVGFFTVFVLLFPQLIIQLFGSDSDELLNGSIMPVRIFIIGLLISANISIFNFLFQLLGHLKISTLFTALQGTILLPAIWLFAMWIPEYLWVAFPASFILLIIMQRIFALIESSKNKGINSITLIPEAESNNSFDRSVNYTLSDTKMALQELTGYFKTQNINDSVANKVELCCEELMLNLITYAKNDNEKRSFDIHITNADDKINVSMKDDGKPFNPTIKYQETEKNEDVKNIGLQIVNGICKDINYKYMYGQNMVYMKFPIKE